MRSSWAPRVLGFLCLAFSILHAGHANSLYDPEDPLHILNSTNFDEEVFTNGRNTVWFIQFYNVWCGHCIRFSPVFKEFAREIENWKRVVSIGVVNCADTLNTKLCRSYEVRGFPTMKMLWLQAEKSDTGEEVTGPREIPLLENQILRFLDFKWDSRVPSNWPNIQPTQASSKTFLQEQLPSDKTSTILLIEEPDSVLGKKVILDLSEPSPFVFRRALTTNTELMNSLGTNVDLSANLTVIKIDRDGNENLVFNFNGALVTNETDIRNKIFEYIFHRPRVGSNDPDPDTTTVNPDEDHNVRPIYLADLRNAVHYSLSQEIALTAQISGEKFSALKEYLAALRDFFPGEESTKNFLTSLNNHLSNKRPSITGEEFSQLMELIKGEQGYSMQLGEWVTCKGSTPKYRGYPCSLWVLFHTLTVQAHSAADPPNAMHVLFAIRDYVKNYFSCKECARHFMQMAANLVDEVQNSRQAVLWLWRSHNKVNRRLHGDPTEDPSHPKIQFPPRSLCQSCVSDQVGGDVTWDDQSVLEFLEDYYGRAKIRHAMVNSDIDNTL